MSHLADALVLYHHGRRRFGGVKSVASATENAATENGATEKCFVDIVK
jgi:hypothetical protein